MNNKHTSYPFAKNSDGYSNLVAAMPGMYKISGQWKWLSTATRTTLLTPSRMSIDINGIGATLSNPIQIDLTSVDAYDSGLTTDYTLGPNRSDKKLYIVATITNEILTFYLTDDLNTFNRTVDSYRYIEIIHFLDDDVKNTFGEVIDGAVLGDIDNKSIISMAGESLKIVPMLSFPDINTNQIIHRTDLNTLYISDGVNWIPLSGGIDGRVTTLESRVPTIDTHLGTLDNQVDALVASTIIVPNPIQDYTQDDILDITIDTFGDLSGSAKWYGGVLAPNGKIYGIPYYSTQVLEIDPVTKTTTLFGDLSGGTKWYGGVLAPNGKIYGIPYSSTQVLEIDPETKETTLFGDLSGGAKWVGGVLAPNGKIYGIPYNSTQILEIDPVTKTTTLFGDLSGGAKWVGGVLAPNGKIYGIPYGSTQVLEIDPVTKTTTLFGDLSGGAKWQGGVLAPNGKIYGIPSNSTQVLEIDPVTKTTTLFGSLSGSYRWVGGVLAPNGTIYGIPYNSTQILEIETREKCDDMWMLSPYVNKF